MLNPDWGNICSGVEQHILVKLLVLIICFAKVKYKSDFTFLLKLYPKGNKMSTNFFG